MSYTPLVLILTARIPWALALGSVKDIKGVGTLRIGYVLLEYEEMPVLFTCINENKTIYLCHLNEIRECLKWNIAEISQDTLRELLFKQIDIKTALTTKPIIFIIEADNEKEISYAQETAKVNPLDLPKENTYLRIDEDEANKYIADSEKRLSNNK